MSSRREDLPTKRWGKNPIRLNKKEQDGRRSYLGTVRLGTAITHPRGTGEKVQLKGSKEFVAAVNGYLGEKEGCTRGITREGETSGGRMDGERTDLSSRVLGSTQHTPGLGA
ncbi:hypothetical protein KQX54_013382 [Cotesia glomerata]|uniref:Uncharacterized protein n=1 Tax=Cotesia glomerata TaxID=32391 RepID=A0AAV7J5K4_COTGL|nr:hypothetical protein KQX54_013382 [Cotesia glomerata]